MQAVPLYPPESTLFYSSLLLLCPGLFPQPYSICPIPISILTLGPQTLTFPFCIPTAFPKPLGLYSPAAPSHPPISGTPSQEEATGLGQAGAPGGLDMNGSRGYQHQISSLRWFTSYLAFWETVQSVCSFILPSIHQPFSGHLSQTSLCFMLGTPICLYFLFFMLFYVLFTWQSNPRTGWIIVIKTTIQRGEAKAQRGEVTCQALWPLVGVVGFSSRPKIWHKWEPDREIGIAEGPNS